MIALLNMISYLFFLVIFSFPFLLQARPSHANFLNKKIEMYDELALVLGKNIAIRSFSKGVTDVDGCASNAIDLDNDLEEVSLKK